jgi:hypothetical protein
VKRPASATALRIATALLLPTAFACSDDPTEPEPLTQCTTTVTAAQGDSFVELCALSGPVRHVRIENLRAPATHASAQVVFGFDAPPASATATLAADQFRVLLYGGGTPAPAALIQASFGTADETLDGGAAFLNAATTVCFDLHDGGADTAPAFVLWVSGQKGADCANRSTLTAATAFGARAYWGGAKGAVDKAAKVYFRQAASGGTAPAVTVSTEPVLTAAAISAATTCTSNWATNTDWQALCAPSAGIARHVRLSTVASTANNSYFYAVLGQDPSPTGNPAAAAGKLIITGGRANSGASWTWFRFGSGSTTQFSYATDAGSALYTAAPSTICFDTGATASGNARVVFWATGAKGADCAAPATLTLTSALYDSSTDAATGSIWSAPFALGKLNFITTNNATSTIGALTVSSEAVAL